MYSQEFYSVGCITGCLRHPAPIIETQDEDIRTSREKSS